MKGTDKILAQEDFVTTEKRNRNVRMDPHEEEALLRAAEDYTDKNVSDIVRKVWRGQLPDAVTMGYLCGTCYETDCKAHKKVVAAIYRPKPRVTRKPPEVPEKNGADT